MSQVLAPTDDTPVRRVLIVADNISLRQSGETSVPYYYLQGFVRRGIDVRAVCHARVQEGLRRDIPAELFRRIHFVEDSWLQMLLWRIGQRLPYRVEDLVVGQVLNTLTQRRMRRVAARLVAAHGMQIVFQPTPISPKSLSLMNGLGAPLVIGPMCGGLELPPAFRHMDGRLVGLSIAASRAAVNLLHRLFPGKRKAAALLVGNARTARALPPGVRGKVYEVVESGVDLQRWPPKAYPVDRADGIVRFVFCGRLVDWKGAQYLVRAFAPLARRGGVRLDLIGDGELFGSIREMVAAEGIGDAVVLHGRIPLQKFIDVLREGDVYVMPSLRECGGLALLEAMAIGLPIVATNWMGPAEYLDRTSAILVDPTSEQAFIDEFSAAMSRLARSPDLRRSLGEGARRRVLAGYFGWERKADRVIQIMG
jgi:glycosyltransferase involved in cell wall biosynthesis